MSENSEYTECTDFLEHLDCFNYFDSSEYFNTVRRRIVVCFIWIFFHRLLHCFLGYFSYFDVSGFVFLYILGCFFFVFSVEYKKVTIFVR